MKIHPGDLVKVVNLSPMSLEMAEYNNSLGEILVVEETSIKGGLTTTDGRAWHLWEVELVYTI